MDKLAIQWDKCQTYKDINKNLWIVKETSSVLYQDDDISKLNGICEKHFVFLNRNTAVV